MSTLAHNFAKSGNMNNNKDEYYGDEYNSDEEEEEIEDDDEEVDMNEMDNDDDEDKDVDKVGDEDEEDNNLDEEGNNEVEDMDIDPESLMGGADEDEDEDDDEDENYLQKFDSELNKNYLVDFHPEAVIHNEDEIKAMSVVIRDNQNNVIDDLHKTIPYLTKYERTRILGQRAKQINSGAQVFVKVPEKMIDGYLIAELELKMKRIPFIVRRPIPSGGCEYWNLKDLEIIHI